MKIAIIGAGHVATVLGKKIRAAGHTITQVYAHTNQQQAQALATLLEAAVIQHFTQLDATADIYLLAVSDTALVSVAQEIRGVNGLVLHTAGAVSIQVLQATSSQYGVLYPLQSLRQQKEDYEDIPLLIDGNTTATTATIKSLAATLTSQVQPADDAYRLKLHTAAVLVSNFTNHLYSLAARYCHREGVDFSLLYPLIKETAVRLQQYEPAQMQTGPAIRNDVTTIARHLELLQAYPHIQKLYEVLTQSIQAMNSEQ